MTSLSSSCTRHQVGAVIVTKKGEVISTGFNDVPEGQQKCRELGMDDGYCYRHDVILKRFKTMNFCPKCGKKIDAKNGSYPYKCDGKTDEGKECMAKLPNDFIPGRTLDICRALHAEEHAIIHAPVIGGELLKDCEIYTTLFPCMLCAKQIAEVGIKRVIYLEPYPMKESIEILKNANVTMQLYQGVLPRTFISLFKDDLT
jgi:deoxycytidylate deaminase